MRLIFIILTTLFFLLQYRLWFGDGSVHRNQSLVSQIEQLTEDNEQAELKNQQLRQEVIALKSDQNEVEALARTQLGMVKKGETLVLILPKKRANQGATIHNSTQPLPQKAD